VLGTSMVFMFPAGTTHRRSAKSARKPSGARGAHLVAGVAGGGPDPPAAAAPGSRHARGGRPRPRSASLLPARLAPLERARAHAAMEEQRAAGRDELRPSRRDLVLKRRTGGEGLPWGYVAIRAIRAFESASSAGLGDAAVPMLARGLPDSPRRELYGLGSVEVPATHPGPLEYQVLGGLMKG